MPTFTLITMPTTAELAWAELAVRQQIIDAYNTARTQAEATAARWEALAYDKANPKASSLIAELDADHQPVAA